jgi:hypothetical protein
MGRTTSAVNSRWISLQVSGISPSGVGWVSSIRHLDPAARTSAARGTGEAGRAVVRAGAAWGAAPARVCGQLLLTVRSFVVKFRPPDDEVTS